MAPYYSNAEACNPIDFLCSESDAEMARQIAAVLNKNCRLMTQSSEDGFFAAADNQLTEAPAQELYDVTMDRVSQLCARKMY
ncbi:hypothetical protein IQ254_04600 [Nodosilinea sp. LEGE 07088]|uniref:hypothetical protein n=1 Tax=Nodosilinea sp. LEGE 07088 TaxID=2777968 RepID=UPI00187F60DC|nr:hypothetical protein [Nodosilinea sp. LEGE 07088]MBE9136484.1 hypothetical protein [Nodosilinea sp. LEGE 07088]